MKSLAVTAALAVLVGGSARSATRYDAFDELSALCIGAKSDLSVVRKAALARGYKEVESGKQTQFAIGENDGSWVTVVVGTTALDDPDLGPVASDTCMLYASPGAGEPEKVLAWLGLKDVDYSKGVSFPFEDLGRSPLVINPRDAAARKRAFANGTLRIISVLPLQDSVRLMFMAPRPAKASAPASVRPSQP